MRASVQMGLKLTISCTMVKNLIDLANVYWKYALEAVHSHILWQIFLNWILPVKQNPNKFRFKNLVKFKSDLSILFIM